MECWEVRSKCKTPSFSITPKKIAENTDVSSHMQAFKQTSETEKNEYNVWVMTGWHTIQLKNDWLRHSLKCEKLILFFWGRIISKKYEKVRVLSFHIYVQVVALVDSVVNFVPIFKFVISVVVVSFDSFDSSLSFYSFNLGVIAFLEIWIWIGLRLSQPSGAVNVSNTMWCYSVEVTNTRFKFSHLNDEMNIFFRLIRLLIEAVVPFVSLSLYYMYSFPFVHFALLMARDFWMARNKQEIWLFRRHLHFGHVSRKAILGSPLQIVSVNTFLGQNLI